jgi:hypothetical protein
MVNHETNKRKRAAFSARVSVEVIVVILVVSATVGIFTAKMLAGGWDDSDSPVPGKVVGLRHDAISEKPVFPTSSICPAPVERRGRVSAGAESKIGDTPPIAAVAAVDQDKSSQILPRNAGEGATGLSNVQLTSNNTIVRNGVTVLSPPLLVPVINDDAIQMANGSEVLASPRKVTGIRKRSHHVSRARTRAQRRVVGWAAFRRSLAGNP